MLSLLLRKRTVSTKAALKLLDDASAAIHYNREILQTALDHVRQGIAVFDKDLRLVCWNRQFGDILDLPPDLTRVGVGLDEILRSNAAAGRARPGPGRGARSRPHRPLHAEHRAGAGALRRARPGGRGALQPHAGRRHGDDRHRHHAERRGGRSSSSAPTPRWKRRVRERTAELTRLNAELGRAKADAEEANISKTRFLAAASHDILQPLNAARLYVTSLIERQGARRGRAG